MASFLRFSLASGFYLLAIVTRPVSADSIAVESFSYTSGDLHGKGAVGSGWKTAWDADQSTLELVDTAASPLVYNVPGGGTVNGGSSALRINGSGTNAGSAGEMAFREIDPQGGDLYFSFLLRYEPTSGGSFDGLSTTPDFLGLWFDDLAPDSGNSDHSSNTPQAGLINNIGTPTGNDFFARYNTGTVFRTGGDVQANLTYMVAGRIFKDSSTTYNKITIWVNPDSIGSSPLTSTSQTSSITSIKYLGIRAANLDSNDSFLIDEIRLGTVYADVVPVPLPAPLFAVAALLGGVGLYRARRTA
jgi:hypothetical protein